MDGWSQNSRPPPTSAQMRKAEPPNQTLYCSTWCAAPPICKPAPQEIFPVHPSDHRLKAFLDNSKKFSEFPKLMRSFRWKDFAGRRAVTLQWRFLKTIAKKNTDEESSPGNEQLQRLALLQGPRFHQSWLFFHIIRRTKRSTNNIIAVYFYLFIFYCSN